MSSTPLQNDLSNTQIPRQRGGPRTALGKARASRNAFKHGRYARERGHLQTLSASMAGLGEDPREFARLRAMLLESFHPSTGAAILLVEDIASLRWQRRRLERGQAALLARRVQELELERQRHSLQVNQQIAEIIPVSQLRAGLLYDPDSPTKFQKLLEWLEQLKHMAATGDYADAPLFLGWVYGPNPPLRGGLIKGLFKTLAEASPETPPDSTRLSALRREIEGEISDVTQQYHLYIRKYVEVTPVMREECLAPTAEQRWLMREMNMIDRQIAQKTRLLLGMERREQGFGEDGGAEPAGRGASKWRRSREKKNV